MKRQPRSRFVFLVGVLIAASGCTQETPPLIPTDDADVMAPDAQVPMPDASAQTCAVGTIDCDGVCANVVSDSLNCGSCGNECPSGFSCAVGRCDCAAPMLGCDGVCIDPSSDAENCGECGKTCEAGESCLGGTCVVQCDAPSVLCASQDEVGTTSYACADVESDPMNCGTCGTSCRGGAMCDGGQCTCPTGQVSCSGVCTDLSTDAENCGACLNSCGVDGVCMAGTCTTCGTGLSACGSPARCVDTTTSRLHCGACGIICGPGEGCNDGACECLPGFTDCDGLCANLSGDPRNCGGCGIDCGHGGTCSAGVCVCAEGATMCGAECAELDSSDAHCGACDVACGAGEACYTGACLPINNSCATARPITGDLVVTGEKTEIGGPPPTGDNCGGGDGAVALYYAVTIPVGQEVLVQTTPRGDIVLFEQVACGDQNCVSSTDSSPERMVLANTFGSSEVTRIVGVRPYGTFSGTPSFDIAFTYRTPVVAPNAFCPAATPITGDMTITGENTGEGGPRPTGTNCGGGSGEKALYYAVTIPVGQEVRVQTTPSGDIVLFEHTGCGSADCITSTDSSPEQLTLSNVFGSSDATRIVGVRAWGTPTTPPTFDIAFTYATPVVAPNALCPAATPITGDMAITGENTAEGGPRPTGTNCGNGTGNKALYYAVTIPVGQEVVVQTTPSGNIVLFEQETCADTACVTSTDSSPERLTLSNLFGTSEVTRFVGVRAQSATASTPPTFNIAFTYTTPVVAPNAFCTGAIAITADTTITGENTGEGGPRPSGTGCGSGAGPKALYYAVTIPAGQQVRVQTTPSGDILAFELAGCGDVECALATDSSPEQLTLMNFTGTSDVTRIVGVRAFGTPTTPPTFDIAFTYETPAVAPNAFCTTATAITADTTITAENTSVGGPRPNGTSCGNGGGPKALYYAVTLQARQEVTVQTTPTGDIVLFEQAACGDTACVTSTDSSPERLTLANPGTSDLTRIVGVRAYGTPTTAPTFNIAFTYRTLPQNAFCATATPITGDTTITGENTDLGGPRPNGANCGTSSGDRAVYYAVTVPAGQSVVAAATAGSDVDLVLFEQTACGNDCVRNTDWPESLTLNNTSGTSDVTRIVGVRGYSAAGGSFPGGAFDIMFTYSTP